MLQPDDGEGVLAIIEPESSEAALESDYVLSALSGQLAKYKLPKQIFWTAGLPRNTFRKVIKNELRARSAGTFLGESARNPARAGAG